MNETDSTLAGKLLIAMPDMSDPRFANTVIYMCAHSEEGGMGLIVNKPQKDVSFQKLLEQMDIPTGPGLREIDVHYGGPVDHQRGFVLHSSDYASEGGTLDVDDTFRMTATLQVLEDIAKGVGPDISMLALGYAGWGPGQLEYEISQNGWLTCPASDQIVFGNDNDGKWSAALKLMGIDPLLLSSTAGRA
ncbi:YqgE/AlgH family protein [Loktanella sp. Alg231-35]|uniref:YqgE/AlgH family protein n=1 Tax=Loktanella sp. Alg231-35 TaxID=1922220 RepID=UPI000D55AE19|nr:YqgE/AlgH family protein [Loktanella sp. Alg231-35]